MCKANISENEMWAAEVFKNDKICLNKLPPSKDWCKAAQVNMLKHIRG